LRATAKKFTKRQLFAAMRQNANNTYLCPANWSCLRIFDSITDYKTAKPTIATIGTFDGVHIGHRKIIEKLVQDTQNGRYNSLVLTFFPHPRMVLQGSSVKLLNTLDEKVQLLAQTGLDELVVHPFNQAFASLGAEAFVKSVLVDAFNIHKIIIGHDHRFGKNRSADIRDLIAFGEKYGFEVEQIPAQEVDDVSVSSTKIRHAIEAGDIGTANAYLGYAYLLTGTVVSGRQLGRTIGFPTANLSIAEAYKLIPKIGIYVVQSTIDGKVVYGMMSIGTNPTVGGQVLSVEVYFLDFDADLYGRTLQVSILHRLRDEEKFASLDLLKAQIRRDETHARAFLKTL
jgi:riboflavin kinase/FMN adenylyltransferase